MPYYRKYNRKKYPRKKYGYKRKKFLRRRAMVSKRPELKFWDTSITTTNIDYASPNMILINNLIQGTTDSDVIGRNYCMKVIYIKLAFYINVNTNMTMCRFILFHDKECNGTAPTTGQLLTSGAGLLSVTSPINQLYVNRFRVLLDKTVSLSLGGKDCALIKKYLKTYIKVNINGTNSGTISDIQHNSLYLFVTCDRTTTNLPNFLAFFRVRFLDV